MVTTAPKQLAVDVKGLVKLYPVRRSDRPLVAVDNFDLSITPGERVGLIGESGSGKTTVGRCLLRLTEPTAGEIWFAGEDLGRLGERQLRPLRPRMQMVFQDPAESLDPRLDVRHLVREPLRQLRTLGPVECERRVLQVLDDVELGRWALDKRPRELSAGQAQRVGIARALVSEPEFIVFDEPTSALDLVSRVRILDVLLRLQQERGFTSILISHDLASVEMFCSRIVVMYLGKVVEAGPADAIFECPRHPYTKALLAAFLPPEPDAPDPGHRLVGEIPSPLDRPPGCPLVGRCPEELRVCSSAEPPLTDLGDAHFVACYANGTPWPPASMALETTGDPNGTERSAR